MKACIFQPPYFRDTAHAEEHFAFKLDLLDKCDETMDLIVLPEYSELPCVVSTAEEKLFYHQKYIDVLLNRCVQTAKRCNAIVCVNAMSLEENGYRNTTYVYDRQGNLAGKYFKKHLAPSEMECEIMDTAYTMEFSEPYVLELEGLRFGFLTCYDFYFYEAFANMAKQDLDIIIGCSHQRSDTHDAIEIMCRFLAYNTNAYVVRSSVSFAEDSQICGASMVVSPYGKVLCNMKARFGMETVEFDPHDKYLKPAGFGNPDAPHYKYIEYGRKPWQYRAAGPATVAYDSVMKYPRICAHRGFNTVAPENSMPAFGAAVAMGAQEIEFDIWSTKDGVLVSCHDDTLERVSNGTGKIADYTYEELQQFDFGVKHGEKFRGLKIPTFEEILRKFAGLVVMNVHVKIWNQQNPGAYMEEIVSLVRKYDCEKYVYFMTACDEAIAKLQKLAPDMKCCVGWNGDKNPMSMVNRALALGAHKIQLFKPYFTTETVKKAKENGILCNVFYADDPEEARAYLDMGIDTILTNDYNLVSQILK